MITESLRVFIEVADQKSFSRAAEALFLSQPGVSLHIRNLETEFKTKLIHRSPKNITLTRSGKILYDHASQILQLYEKAKKEINQLKNGISGDIRIGASFTIGEYLLPRLVAEHAREYPNINISVTIANTEEITQLVRSNCLDVGLVEGNVTYNDLKIEPFMEDEMILIIPPDHQLGKKQIVNSNNLQNQIWILREDGSGTRAFSDQLFEELNLIIKRTFVFSSSQGVKEAVSAGLGIALVSRLIVDKELSSGEIKTIEISEKKLTRKFFILQPKPLEETKALGIFLERLKLMSS